MSRTHFNVIGTELRATTYADLYAEVLEDRARGASHSVNFANTQIVALRRWSPRYRELTTGDDFLPDGMPLVWCMNAQGAGLGDRVYGVIFMHYCLERSPAEVRHYFLGASEACLARLCENMRRLNPQLTICGTHHGYFPMGDEEAEAKVREHIHAANPDFIWVGLGTPIQHEWIGRNRRHLERGVFFSVGFAFDVYAGMKKDAPMWFQRHGLTWLYRLCREPRRLIRRYLKWNTLFLGYLAIDLLRRRSPKL